MKYSKLPRIYINSELFKGGFPELNESDCHYIKNVLRAKNAEQIRVFNENGGEFFAKVNIQGKTLSLEIQEQFRKPIQNSRGVILLASIIKPDKFEMICDMATQIGVTKIIPIITARVQRKELNRDRLSKIILESVRQSERLTIPILEDEMKLSEISQLELEQIYFANEMEESDGAMQDTSANNSCAFLIGPEGGFTDEEIAFLKALPNITSVSLGNNVLRSETAAIALLAKVLL